MWWVVSDVDVPRVLSCPRSFVVQLLPGEAGRSVTWPEPVFHDNHRVQHIYRSKVQTTLSQINSDPSIFDFKYVTSIAFFPCSLLLSLKENNDPYARQLSATFSFY